MAVGPIANYLASVAKQITIATRKGPLLFRIHPSSMFQSHLMFIPVYFSQHPPPLGSPVASYLASLAEQRTLATRKGPLLQSKKTSADLAVW